MALFEYKDNKIFEIKKTSLVQENILERKHLQKALKEKIEIICPDCLVISEEFSEWSGSNRRIDLLAIDKSANLVVIELKRNETGEHMELQAIRYAAMVSTLTFRRAVELFGVFLESNNRNSNPEEEILNFLEWDEPQEEDFGYDVRIVLVSENFSKELTTAVMWLNEKDLDIRCIRLIPVKFKDSILFDIQQVIPLPEAENFQVKLKQKSDEQREARKSNKDYTKYRYNNLEYNKRKIVLAIVKDWITKNQPKKIEDLQIAFPQKIHSSGLFVPYSQAQEIYERQNIFRHFLEEEELIKFENGEKYALSNQWGKGNLEKFINRAKELNYEVEKI